MANVRFKQFLSQGTGVTGRPLGAIKNLTFIQNGVELQFSMDAAVKGTYRNLKPLQWSGPEAIWVKDGPILGGTWRKIHSGPGTGADNPEPGNVVTSGTLCAYWDAPGPNVGSYLKTNPSQIYVVQNFTGWIAGDPLSGGSAGKRLCDVAAWHSVINIANVVWGQANAVPIWERVHGNRAGTGWADPSKPPAV